MTWQSVLSNLTIIILCVRSLKWHVHFRCLQLGGKLSIVTAYKLDVLLMRGNCRAPRRIQISTPIGSTAMDIFFGCAVNAVGCVHFSTEGFNFSEGEVRCTAFWFRAGFERNRALGIKVGMQHYITV